MPEPADLERRTTELLQRLIQFNTVNPPGNEQALQEFLKEKLEGAGYAVELLADVEGRPNLIASMKAESDGPTLCLLGHVDTVLADPSEWEVDPWSGELKDDCVWGRGALDMKSQVAAEVAAAVALGEEGWRPRVRRAEARDHRRRGDRGGARRAVAVRAAPGQGARRHRGERGRRRGVRLRRPPPLRRLRGGEGRVPLHAHGGGHRRPCLDPAHRRQRAHQARPGARSAGRRPGGARALARAGRVPRRDRGREGRPGRRHSRRSSR